MSWDISMTLFVTLVLFDVVQVVSTQDNSAMHLGAHNTTRQDTSSNGHISSEWALVIDIFPLNCLLWSSESKTYVLVPPISTLSWDLSSLAHILAVSAPLTTFPSD